MNLFIDTNIYLTFYDFSNDDIEELKKLKTAIERRRIKLFIPEQTIHEYKRNREGKIAISLKKLEDQNPPNSFPRFMLEYPDYQHLDKIVKEYQEVKNSLLNNVQLDIKSKSLGADKLIEALIQNAERIVTTESIINQAKSRYDIGNPPGKDGSYGDSINWESLLIAVPEKEDVHIIARDKDYVSKLNKEQINNFLQEEWEEKKQSKIHFYTSLSSFFSQHFSNIKLATELERDSYVNALVHSMSFASTHALVARLKQFTDFTSSEVLQMVTASIENDQISIIATDVDINDFFTELVENHLRDLPDQTIYQFDMIFRQNEMEEDCNYCNTDDVKDGEVCSNCGHLKHFS